MRATIGNQRFINETLEKNKLDAKKKFGQNFLTDQNILTSIADASEVDSDTLVIEIGPGLGSLTEHLCQRAGFVLCYEIDNDLIPLLEDNLKEYNNFIIINKDILTVDINEDIKKYQKNLNKVYVVANLPYYITTPIILGLLSQTNLITRYVLMMQLEVADRICGTPKTKDYNALSIAIGYRAKATKVVKVPRTVFIPSPNVDSAVVKLDLYDKPMYQALNEEHFFRFIRDAFKQRRKTLFNNLSSEYDKEFISKMFNDNNIKLNVRAEELSIKDFVDLDNYIIHNYNK